MGEAKRRQREREQLGLTRNTRPTPGQQVPPGMKTIAFLSPAIDCCVEKIINEMAPYWFDRGYFPLVVNEKKFRELLPYTPKSVTYFRAATKSLSREEVIGLSEFIPYLRGLGIQVNYYIDDFLVTQNRNAPLFLMSKVNQIIVATDQLQDFIAHNNPGQVPIAVIKTHIDLPSIDPLPVSKLVPKNYYNILFTSEGRLGALMLRRIVERLNAEPDKYSDVNIISVTAGVAQVRSIINEFRNIKKTYFERLPLKEFYMLAKGCNLILAPGEIGDLDYMIPKEIQQVWINSKSCVKYTLAGAVGVPCIVTKHMLEYSKAVTHGETGFVAESIEDWIKYIDLLHGDKDLSTTIGKNARRDVEAKWDIRKRADEMLDALLGTIKLQSPIERKVWLPPVAGGPRTFHDTLKKYLPMVSNNKVGIVDTIDKTVEAAIVPAFVGADEVIRAKSAYPSLRILSRIDGLPFDFEGNIYQPNMDAMLKIMNAADILIWQSKFAKRMWEPYFKEDKESVIIYNGVDLEIFKKEGKKFPLDTKKTNILHVNISTFKHKRIDLLEECIVAHPNLNFILAGHYIDTSIINDMEKWSMYPNVTYLGPMIDYSPSGRDQLASLYRAANFLLFTSNHEGCPNTVLEATGCGLPIIYNEEVDIVPELLGDRCYPYSQFDKAVAEGVPYLEGLQELAERYSAEQMARNYLEVLG